jgi:transposase
MEATPPTSSSAASILALEGRIVELEARCSDYESRCAEYERLIGLFREQLRLERTKRFGRSSEKTASEEQTERLFNEAEAISDKESPEPDIDKVTRKNTRAKGKREADLSGMDTEQIDYEMPEGKRVCPRCSNALVEMSTDTRRELVYIPATYKVIEHVTHIYTCRDCENDIRGAVILRADSPNALIKGSLCSASLMSAIMCDKYDKAVPLYRQERSLAAEGISLSRQTMANWMLAGAAWMQPLYDAMHKALVSRDVLHADETRLTVLHDDGRETSHDGYMWLYRTSGDATSPVVLYDYQPTRSHEHPKKFLAGFDGWLHADGYSGYHKLKNMTVVGCFSHLRRYYNDALLVMRAADRKNSAPQHALDLINRMFSLEHDFADMRPEERQAARMKLSKPVADELLAWARSCKALPKSLLGKAIHYTLSQWDYLMHVFDDGRLELSNNRAERSIKPFVIGRKNWLFSNTRDGAHASAVIYSLIETAKENGLNPRAYLTYVFERLPNMTTSQLPSLLPWSNLLPQSVLSKNKASRDASAKTGPTQG